MFFMRVLLHVWIGSFTERYFHFFFFLCLHFCFVFILFIFNSFLSLVFDCVLISAPITYLLHRTLPNTHAILPIDLLASIWLSLFVHSFVRSFIFVALAETRWAVCFYQIWPFCVVISVVYWPFLFSLNVFFCLRFFFFFLRIYFVDFIVCVRCVSLIILHSSYKFMPMDRLSQVQCVSRTSRLRLVSLQ